MSVSQAITSLTLLNLIDAPLSELTSAIPLGWSAMGCFSRIQTFLLQDSRADARLISNSTLNGIRDRSQPNDGELELSSSLQTSTSNPQVRVENGSFGWSDSTSETVKGVNITISSMRKLTLIIGPVGCGKVSANCVIHACGDEKLTRHFKVDTAQGPSR